MDPLMGEIRAFGFNFAPRGWAACDGQLLAINSYQALFSLLGTTYGGDGRTTFALPDLRGRVSAHAGAGPGLTPRSIGQRYGHEHQKLTDAQLPPHNHGVSCQVVMEDADADEDRPNTNGTAMLAKPTAPTKIYAEDGQFGNVKLSSKSVQVTEQNVGAGQDVWNLPPSLVINYCISLEGTYPSRS